MEMRICPEKDLREIFAGAKATQGLSYRVIALEVGCTKVHLAGWVRGSARMSAKLIIRALKSVGYSAEPIWRVEHE